MDYLKDIRSLDKVSEWLPGEGVYHVSTPHVLSQVAGYLKFSRSNEGRVLYRGQDQMRKSMRPSLFRPTVHLNGNHIDMTFNVMHNRIHCIRDYVKNAYDANSFIGKTPEYACEAILQQYGFKTRWLDFVDNIWIALWFATHTSKVAGKKNEYLNFEPSMHKYSYIYLMQFGEEVFDNKKPGLTQTDCFKIIDLRVSTPSIYIRPHSQHGLLVTRKAHGSLDLSDYQDKIVGIIRVETNEALKWQGSGTLSSTHFVFPPPSYDWGYRALIEKLPTSDSQIGTLQFIGP